MGQFSGSGVVAVGAAAILAAQVLNGCSRVQKLAAKTPVAGLAHGSPAELALDEAPYCPGFLPETDTTAREQPPMVPTGVAVGQYCRENALTPGSMVFIKDGPGKRREFCPCPSNRCDAFGHPAFLGAFDPHHKKINLASASMMSGREDCGWPVGKERTRESFIGIDGYVADGPGKEGPACKLLGYIPTCGNVGSCCDGGRLTGRPLSAQRIADSKDPQVNFKVCNDVATNRRPLKDSLCQLPLQGACSAGIWTASGKELGKSGPGHSKGGHDACWAVDQNNADGVVQAHCHDGGELVRAEPGSPDLAGHRECHLVRQGAIPGQLDVFTFVVDCSADGGDAVAIHQTTVHHEGHALSAKLLTEEELHAAKHAHGHGKPAIRNAPRHVPRVVDESEW
ncbi:hypothetical protein EBZ80_10290 [bacterium]|nr:hypothetical protein [bacterium]